jgi:VanZ family protein
MIIYFILGFTLCSLFFEFNITLKKILLFSILICFLYACSDEIHQNFVVGRDGNFFDVIIDSIGYLFGIFLYFGGRLWIKRKKNS